MKTYTYVDIIYNEKDGYYQVLFTLDKIYPFDVTVGARIGFFYTYGGAYDGWEVEAVIPSGERSFESPQVTIESVSSISIEYKIEKGKYTYPMCFRMYDEVLPMVYGADGKDYPMSKKKDGTPKTFKVLGTKIYFDGAVWQELFLQEI